MKKNPNKTTAQLRN